MLVEKSRPDRSASRATTSPAGSVGIADGVADSGRGRGRDAHGTLLRRTRVADEVCHGPFTHPARAT